MVYCVRHFSTELNLRTLNFVRWWQWITRHPLKLADPSQDSVPSLPSAQRYEGTLTYFWGIFCCCFSWVKSAHCYSMRTLPVLTHAHTHILRAKISPLQNIERCSFLSHKSNPVYYCLNITARIRLGSLLTITNLSQYLHVLFSNGWPY